MGVLAASVEHSGLSSKPEAGSDLNTLAREIMKGANSVATSTTTTSPSTRSTSSTKQHGYGKGLQGRGAHQMGKNVDKARSSCRVAHAGSLVMALATAWSAMATTSVPIGGLSGTMANASREHGVQRSFGSPALSQSPSTTTLHSCQSGRVLLPSKSYGRGAEFSGGPFAHGNDGLSDCKRNEQSYQGSGSTTSRSRSQESQSGRSSRCSSERTGRSTWRFADTSQRSSEAGSIGASASDRQDDRGANQAGCPPHCAGNSTRRQSEEIRSKLKWISSGGFSTKVAGSKNFASSRVPNHNSNCRSTCSFTRSEQFVGKPGGKVSRDAFAADASHHDRPRGLLPGKPNAWSNAGATLHRRRGEQGSTNGFDVSLGPARSEGQHPGRDCTDECRPRSISEGDWLDRKGLPLRLKGDDDDGTSWNPWALNQQLKRGVANMVSQAWDKHERDRRLVSQSRRHVLEALETDWWQSMEAGMNEAFITAVDFGDQVAVSEVFTHTQRVINEAARRGHKVGTPLSLETGWDFLREEDREAGKALVKREKP